MNRCSKFKSTRNDLAIEEAEHGKPSAPLTPRFKANESPHAIIETGTYIHAHTSFIDSAP